MARARNIKPGFFTNDELGELPALARLLWIGLWTICDRDGRCEDRPKKIKAEVLPYDECDADALLRLLAERGFIQRYEADGLRCIQVVNWSKHQNPHVKESPSTIPAPCEHQTSTVQAPEKEKPCTEHAGLIPDSGFRIPDSPSLSPDSSSPTVRREPRSRPPERPVDVDRQAWDDWTALRKAKRAPITETVIAGARAEAEKAGMTLTAFLCEWCARGSQGLKADWIRPSRSPPKSFAQSDADAKAARIAEMTGGILGKKPTIEVFDVTPTAIR
jgi:hypothetical protein